MEAKAQHITLDDFNNNLGQRLIKLRTSKGISQRVAAERAGISKLTYQRLEGRRMASQPEANPTIKTLIALADLFDVGLYELIGPSDV